VELVLKPGVRYGLYSTCLAALLTLAGLELCDLLPIPKGAARADFLGLVLMGLCVAGLHELVHYAAMRGLGVECGRPKLIKIPKTPIPAAVALPYSETPAAKYALVALSPQAISAALLALSTSETWISCWAYEGYLGLLAYALLVMHLAASAGDFYGLLFLVYKTGRMFPKARVACRPDLTAVVKW